MPESQPELYYVDPTAEIASVLRGIKHAQADRVAIVLPEEPRLFRNDVNLRLMAAYARESGKEIALITQDWAVIRTAAAHGLRVYASPETAWLPEGRMVIPDITEPMPPLPRAAGKQAAKRARVRQSMAVLALAGFAVASLLFAFTPRVTVVITPAVQHIEQELAVPLVTGGSAGVLMRPVAAPLAITGSKPATGRRVEGVAPAVGTVLFFNESNNEVHVPAGTLVTTDGGQQFTTTAPVQVPAVKPEYFMNVVVGMKAGQAEAPVRAVKTGASGNVAAGRIRILPQGPAGLKVINPEPAKGGSDRTVTYVTDADAESLCRQLAGQLQAQAAAAVAREAGAEAYIIDALLEVEETGCRVQPEVGAEGAAVEATVTGIARSRYLLPQDVAAYADQRADSFVPAGYRRLGSPAVSVVGVEAAATSGELPPALRVTLSIPVHGSVDTAAIARILAGMTPAQAKQALIEGSEAAEVAFQGWARKRLPRWTPWIRVVMADTPAAYAEPADIH